MAFKDIVQITSINLGPRDDRRPPRRGTSMEVYGTIAFNREIIRSLIRFEEPPNSFGRRAPNTLQLCDWLAFVPEVYRSEAKACAQNAVVRLQDRSESTLRCTDQTLEWIALVIRDEIFVELVPVGRPDVY